MRINGQNNSYGYSPLNTPKKVEFKGYFAAPIKQVFVQPLGDIEYRSFVLDLKRRCKQYFDIVIQLKEDLTSDIGKIKIDKFGKTSNPDASCWSQDNKIFLENGNLGIFPESHDPEVAIKLAKKLQIGVQKINTDTQGGNVFLGKKTNGENFALVGRDSLDDTTKEKLAKSLDISPENLHIISQTNFHIDMNVRPLTYPYVLVGDPKLTAKLAQGDRVKQYTFIEKRRLRAQDNHYAKTDKTVKELEKQGFIPIRVPGLLEGEKGVNFMNAIVHQEADGSLIYITNKTHIGEKKDVKFEQIFKKDLQAKFPKVKEVIFIDGEDFVQESLTELEGGTHCLTCERPDFEKWAELLKISTP